MARSYLTTNAVLDRAFSHLRTNSVEHRGRMLSWLNSAMQQVINEPRKWNFLETEATITIASNTIPLPDNFDRENYFTIGDLIYTPSNLINDADAASGSNGYTIQESGIRVYPDATGTATLNYVARITEYADGDTTVFPPEFLPLFERAMLTAWYEYDVDERLPTSFQLDAVELRKVKQLDNMRKGITKPSSRGYTRGRM